MENAPEYALRKWTAATCPFSIEYVPKVLDDVRRDVVSAFASLPKGGPECGGIFLGQWEDNRVVVTGSAPFECEHAYGPLFKLSPRDQEQLSQYLAEAKQNEASQPVGWFRTRNRSEILFSDADQEIHGRFFPEPWQFAMVLKPDTGRPVRAAVFFRSKDGSIPTQSFHEFTLVAPVANPVAAPVAAETVETPIEAAPVAVEAVETPIVAPPVAAETVETPIEAAPVAVETVETPIALPEPPPQATISDRESLGDYDSVAAPEPPAPARIEVTPEPPPEEDAHSPWRVAMLGTLLVVVAGAVGYEIREKSAPGPERSGRAEAVAASNSIRLVTIDDDGQLQILWDPTLPVIQHSSGATLKITDGADSRTFDIDPTRLQTGSFTYGRQGERVDVALDIAQPSGAKLLQVTTYVGRAPGRSSAAGGAQNGDLAKENARLRADLGKQVERVKQLERAILALRKERGQRKGAIGQSATPAK
jgi:hypothetical protein